MGIEELLILNNEIVSCTKCTDLVYSRTAPVVGCGNINSDLVFIGDAPGKNENQQGVPFVGRAGKLLNNVFAAFNIKREDVYITNTCRCRPPLNRTPTREEISNCSSFLDRELDIINPKLVVCLGEIAAQRILKTDVTIGKLRGKVFKLEKYKVITSYHPSYIIRNPENKKFMHDDFVLIQKELEQIYEKN